MTSVNDMDRSQSIPGDEFPSGSKSQAENDSSKAATINENRARIPRNHRRSVRRPLGGRQSPERTIRHHARA